MFKSVMSRSMIAVLFLGSVGAAHSADLDNIIFAPELPRTVPVEVGNGWYLRGDVGYDFSTDGSATSYRTFNTTTLVYDTQNYATSDFDTDVSVGFGVGYQLSDWFRAEGALDYQNGTFSGSSFSGSQPCTNVNTATGCSTAGSADFNTYGLMANGYVDLGTYVGFTPYVGAGAGYTLMDYDNYNAQETCVDGGDVCGVGPANVQHGGEQSWRFTYALMAGFSYEFMRNLKADLGYRYVNIDGGDTYAFDSASQTAGASGVQGTDNGFNRHEIKATLRYALW